MQSSPNRERGGVTGWLHRLGIHRFCCDWCVCKSNGLKAQSKHYKPNNSKRKTLRTHRDGSKK